MGFHKASMPIVVGFLALMVGGLRYSGQNNGLTQRLGWETGKEMGIAIGKSALFLNQHRLKSEPEQVRVSLAGPSKIKVTWVTSDASSISRVDYGTTSGVYDSYADGSSGTYRYLLYKSGHIHNVVVGPLVASTIYYYRCGGGNTEYSFKTPPFVGSEAPITFAIAGDLGQTEWTSSTLNHIQQAPYDVLILPGDLPYADYYQPLWDSFGRLVEPLASSRPWMVTQGNHEVERIPVLVKSFLAYNMRWEMPYKESGSQSNLYYSFEVANAHILMLGSYADVGKDSDQYNWLVTDLANVDRKKTPWLIAVIHAPWYSSNSAHQGDGEEMRKSMELILKEANVDVLFSGHVHAYERTTKIFNRTIDDSGFYHFTIGDGGNREGLARTFLDPQPDWSVFREASFGHGLLQLFNSTHARWIWHRNQDNAPVIGDELWITRALEPSGACGAVTIH